MTNEKARRLSDVLPQQAAQGRNDGKWFLLEHQLYQAIVSLQSIRQLCENIGDNPESSDDWEMARAVLEIVSPVYVRALGANSSIKHLLAGTERAERLGRMEDG